MTLRQWKLQDAKNHFSEVVESAIKDGPKESDILEILLSSFFHLPYIKN